jgi:S-DNA-T family DNA segregation ATPase FtsK/SpoIIIE
MAKRGPGRPRKDEAQEWAFGLRLSPQHLSEMGAVLLIAAALLIMLAIGGLAGRYGNDIAGVLRLVIGYTTFLIAPIFLALGLGLFFPEKAEIGKANFFGVAVFVLAVSALFAVVAGPSAASDAVNTGAAGGWVGFQISRLMLDFLSGIAAGVILVAIAVISVVISSGHGLRESFNWVMDLVRSPGVREGIKINAPNVEIPAGKSQKQKPAAEPKGPLTTTESDEGWVFPSIDLLESNSTRADGGNVRQNADVIKKTLSDFGVEADVREINMGPTVTQYTLKPAAGVKLNKITALSSNLALALAAQSIRIEAPIPGKSLVGVEMPNVKAATVKLRELLTSAEFENRTSKLSLPLGRDVSGKAIVADLVKMPHLLIAGATGSGKSVGINSILLSLLYQNSPQDMRLILVDPKMVELSIYNDIPHLIAPVISNPKETISALRWTIAEMERRYQIFAEEGRRNIYEYNQSNKSQKMPYIVVVIDEMATLMQVSGNETEAMVVRLAQMARATGIHLILATQRPSVDVITGLIKANVTTRIAFAVGSQVDSRTIIDMAGAEKLLGNGDMLYLAGDISKPQRIQGPLVNQKEVDAVVKELKKQGTPQYDEAVLKMSSRAASSGGGEMGEVDDDLYEEAKEVVIRSGKASSSLLQRRLRIGYARAARLLDILEEQGVVGPPDGARPREVLITNLSDAVDDDDGEEY